MAVASQYHAINGPTPLVGSNCQILPLVPWAPLCYAASFAFNSVILILTIWKLCYRRHIKSPVGSIILRDSLLYFFFTTAMILVVLSIQSLGRVMDYLKPTAVPFATLMTTTMGCRLFLNLKMFSKRTESGLIGKGGAEHQHGISLVPKKTPILIAQGRHSPHSSISSVAPTNSSHETYRTIYYNRALPPLPPRQSVSADIYIPIHRDEREFRGVKDDDLQKDDSPA